MVSVEIDAIDVFLHGWRGTRPVEEKKRASQAETMHTSERAFNEPLTV